MYFRKLYYGTCSFILTVLFCSLLRSVVWNVSYVLGSYIFIRSGNMSVNSYAYCTIGVCFALYGFIRMAIDMKRSLLYDRYMGWVHNITANGKLRRDPAVIPLLCIFGYVLHGMYVCLWMPVELYCVVYEHLIQQNNQDTI